MSTNQQVIPKNMPSFEQDAIEEMYPYFCFHSMSPDTIYFPREGWEGLGNLKTPDVRTVEFESGKSSEVWVFQKVEVCILSIRNSMNVIFKKENGQEVEIPIQGDFTTGQPVRSRSKFFVQVWTGDGALNGECGILTGRGKGFTTAMRGIINRFNNAVVKKMRREFPLQEFSLSHFKIPLYAAAKKTRITSTQKNESRGVFLPSLILKNTDPFSYLLSEKEMATVGVEWASARKWSMKQAGREQAVFQQYALEIGYQQPVQELVLASPEPEPLAISSNI